MMKIIMIMNDDNDDHDHGDDADMRPKSFDFTLASTALTLVYI